MPAIILFAAVVIIRGLFGIDLSPAFIAFLACKYSPQMTISLAAVLGLYIDALFLPGFINFLTNTLISGFALFLKNQIIWEDYQLMFLLALILSISSVVVSNLGLFHSAGNTDLFFHAVRLIMFNTALIWLINR
ncbi:MAG: hypothetical protein FD145_1136 [Candidatus Saganbacteria bacterium]|uniref:Rod shape-determining protein MreD n=1 Tax=Candidatus Saganbacteria bacterium TaxID=2575572 RepID=A0A833L0J2_UNCSA|nr:MAG: hypothetical protein FD145_1136 [Candidatus Saganbacteria bacterium]